MTQIPLNKIYSGKVRDLYEIDEKRMLMVASDRLSAFDVILDDRNERPGVKFKDMELIGVPYRITVGRGIKEGKLEWTDRYTGEKTEIAIEDVYSEIEKVFAM